jgi:Sulfatase
LGDAGTTYRSKPAHKLFRIIDQHHQHIRRAVRSINMADRLPNPASNPQACGSPCPRIVADRQVGIGLLFKGFGNAGTFGGPIDTPNYTRIAQEGVRYNRVHVTALCSPTRAALLTGRNSHAVGFGSVGEFSTGFAGYTAFVADDCVPFPRILRDNGYSTGAFGKWHLTLEGQQGHSGPFDRWPHRLGFDDFYGTSAAGSQ